MKFAQDIILSVPDTSVSTNGEAVLLDQIYGYAVQAKFTGAPSGTLKIQGSCQQLINGEQAPTEWTDIVSTISVSSAATLPLVNSDAQYYKYMRVVWTATGGSGTLKVTYNGKG